MSKDYSLGGVDSINRRKFIKYGAATVSSGIFAACSNISQTQQVQKAARKLDRVSFGLNWVAEAEYGGYYQALATGIYEDYGLEVTIKPGGPRTNVGLLLMLGSVDLAVGGSETITAVEKNLPKITVASIFQKDPQVLIAHPDVGNNSLEQLRDKPIFVSSGGTSSYWPVLKLKYGYKDDQLRAYEYDKDPLPFLKNKNYIQQGILTHEPFLCEQKGIQPVVMLLADEIKGYNQYNFTIETTTRLQKENPDLVQRFVDASIKGWYSYLENPKPGNIKIKKDNKDMNDEILEYSLNKMKEYGIIISGDAETKGIGAMTHERWESFFKTMVEVGVYNSGTKYTNAYTLDFVNKGVDYYKS